MDIQDVSAGKGALCAAILKTLPQWFGIPQSNAAFARDVEGMAMFAAFEGGAPCGFLALNRHTQYAFEIHVMGVIPKAHRQGIGAALVEQAEGFARQSGAVFLSVKTRSPTRPDPNYIKTLAFYRAVGFLPIEEFATLWDAENPALMLIKALGQD